MANRYVKECCLPLMVREVQIQTTVRCHLPRVKKALSKKKKTAGVGENVEELNT